ncbi:MAG: aspartate/glutamate racemase family protein [Nitrososphaerales archaeon]
MSYRLGVIIPSSNTTVEREFTHLLPKGVSLHFSRLKLKGVTLEELKRMEDKVEEVSSLLADAKVDLICYACTTGSLYEGLKHEEEIVKKIQNATNTKAITTARSVIEALKTLKVRDICVATPYSAEINLKVKEFLEDNGFNLLKLKGLGLVNNIEIGKLEPKISYELAKASYHKLAQALFISCTNLRTIEVIAKLERELNIPVISSNIATIWMALKNLGMRGVKNYGKLLKDYL